MVVDDVPPGDDDDNTHWSVHQPVERCHNSSVIIIRNHHKILPGQTD